MATHTQVTTCSTNGSEYDLHRRIIFSELKDRTLWFIRLRWFVAPGIILGIILARAIGFWLSSYTALLGVAVFIFLYNLIFYILSRKLPEAMDQHDRQRIRQFTRLQVGFDFAAMFLLIHFTGGISSPFIFFLIFHIIFASILLRRQACYAFAILVVLGMVLISIAEYVGVLAHSPIIYKGNTSSITEQPYLILMRLGFFAATVLITAFSTTSIITMVRKRITRLVELSDKVDELNEKLHALYIMTQAIVSTRKLDTVLTIVTTELSQILDVLGVSIKLLSKDGTRLRFRAAHGIIADILKNKIVDIRSSPLNRRVLEGESYATGNVTQSEIFQLGEDLSSVNVKSVLFVPLKVEDKIIGILGAYCTTPNRFTEDEIEFFQLAAGLVAIAIENARSYETVERFTQERSWFMMQVAHNLRAPLAAMLSMLEVVREGYKGPVTPEQFKQLRRVERRAGTMIDIISELLLLSEGQTTKKEKAFVPVNLAMLAQRLHNTFTEEAKAKGLALTITCPETIPEIQGDPEGIEQILENLVSNAIKYTPTGGSVGVEFFVNCGSSVRIQVNDSGIGIPCDALPHIFDEFYRAENAREIEDLGTGLGLSIIKQIVERHGGKIVVESEESLGTLFVVHLPVTPVTTPYEQVQS